MTVLLRQTWLVLRNDLRLSWRELRSRRLRTSLAAGLTLLLFAFIQGGMWLLCAATKSPPALSTQGLIWLFFASVMLGVAVHQSITLLFVRSDFDLLLSSPVSPRAILLARLLTIASSGAVAVGLFLVAMVNAAAIEFSPGYLAGYLVGLLLAVLAAALGLAIALLLVRTFGERRGRIIAQVAGALLGATVYLLTQAPTWLPPAARAPLVAAIAVFAESPVSTLPARAGRGEAVPLLLLAGLALVATAAAARALDRALLSGAQQAAVLSTPRRAARPTRAWSAGPLTVAIRKDVRLIVRDPLLLAQVLPSVIYLLPVALALVSRLGWMVLGVMTVLLAGQFSSLLTRVAADGEECWDLIRMSPTAELTQRYAKLAAGIVVPAGLATLCGIGLIATGHIALAIVAWCTAIAVAAGCARIQVAAIRPTPRADLMKRRKGSFSPLQLLAGILVLLGSTGVGFVASGWLLPAAAVLAATLIAVVACFVFVRFAETVYPVTA